MRRRKANSIDIGMLAKIWGFNLLLAIMLVSSHFGIPFLKSSVLEYREIKSDPFDGAVSPITYVPNWLDAKLTNKSLRFEDVPTDDYVEIPRYDTVVLKNEDTSNKTALMTRFTYTTPYMGSYRMNYEEYDGSHLGVDIRAPLGTPVLSIANGVVVKTNDKDTADGKYVIIRHNGANSDGTDLYSSYLHLEAVALEPGTKVRKGQPIGRVGMTGITTTPHVHFQIDKDFAPFHPYWPYSFKDMRDIGLDFFAAVNMGLGKENAIKYTIHPMDFVQNTKSKAVSAAESGKTVSVAASAEVPLNSAPVAPIASPEVVAPVIVRPVSDPVTTAIQTAPVLNSETSNLSPDELPSRAVSVTMPVVEIPTPTPVVQPIVEKVVEKAAEPFNDVAKNSDLRKTIDRLVSKGLVEVSADGKFRPYASLTRREAVLVLAKLSGTLPAESPDLPFVDVLPSDPIAGILEKFLDTKIVSKNSNFRPNDAITRAESAILLVRVYGLAPVEGRSSFSDISGKDGRTATLNAFAKALKIKRGSKFRPEAALTRAEFFRMLDVWVAKVSK